MNMHRLGLIFCLVFGWLCVPTASAGLISFSGDFAPANWTLTTNGGDGSVDTSGAPVSITLFGSDTGSVWQVITLYSITLPSNITLDFYWHYLTFDSMGPFWDPAGYSVNGTWTQLSNSGGPNSQFGFVSGLSLSAGDTFAFYVDAVDDDFGPAQVTISGVPEPGTLALLGAGLGLIALCRRRR